VSAAQLTSEASHWPKGTLFQNPFSPGPPQGPLSLHNNGGFGFVFVSEKIFVFINAKSMVSTFNNTIEVNLMHFLGVLCRHLLGR
jgi:hypothetical protein